MAITLANILTPYESRKIILQCLSAWYIAKLDLCLGGILDKNERFTYLNPIRDIFHHVSELDDLLRAGMKLVLLGNDVPYLQKRLKDPRRYAQQDRDLQIYLLASFPVQQEEQGLVNKMIRFCVNETPDSARVTYDRTCFKVLQMLQPQGMFLMSFGVPIVDGRIERRGSWYSAEAPDISISLKVYVPCFRDRILGEAVLRPSELPRISGYNLGFRRLQAAWALLRIYVRKYTLESAVCLHVNEDEEVRVARARSAQIPLIIRFWYTHSVLEVT
ncbi:hypothetical protein BU23DRAFT_643832 [Bimuria novae-zelandiae CBS 107.79]|uniref:Uncharacterized protein n=1 Tax=Bimuria novae-zelandiae CBS 107.79 TaxID=1447943 RepID=A0A6A5V6P6_9PLEO|nr:hypothetical protein BU23DRAFT_643832 [Bimuria novae-zelandiae CBS 107.79]